MSDWGTARANAFLPQRHHEPYAAIDPAGASLPAAFTVCVVGASRGIGAGIATSYAKAGARRLILAARRRSGLEATAEACRRIAAASSSGSEEAEPIEVEIVECDITSTASVAGLARRIRERFEGKLDVVAINSGYSGPVVLKITDTDPETFGQATNVNYFGTFLCAKFLIPFLQAKPEGAGAFIIVSSWAAFIVRGPIANAQYCVSKAAQLKLAEHIHEQYSAEEDGGLSVYAVHPGAVNSEMALQTAPEDFKKFLTDSPDLCGAVCVWLSKDSQKRWLSGRLINAKWDVEALLRRKDEIVTKDLLKLGPVF